MNENFKSPPLTTEIKECSSEKRENKSHYVIDLQGRKVKTPQKNGLYIKNGKKFIAR